MAKLGISTGSAPNDGTGDSLLDGAIKVNTNFTEIYTAIGDGTTLAVPVTSVSAGTGINVSGSTGNVTITNTGIANTNNLRTDFLEVSGISTLSGGLTVTGNATATQFVGGGANITGISTLNIVNYSGGSGGGSGVGNTNNIRTNFLEVSGISTLSGGLTVAGISTIGSTLYVGQSSNQYGVIIKRGATDGGEINLTGPNSSDANSTYYSNIRLNKVGGGFKYNLEFHTNGYSTGDIGDFIFYKRGTSYQRTERMRLSGETGNLTVTGGGSFSGISTFSGDINLNAANIVLALSSGSSDDRLKFHTSEIYQDTLAFRIISNTGGINLRGGSTNSWTNASGAEEYIVATENDSVDLYYDNSKKLETTTSGVKITGESKSDSITLEGRSFSILRSGSQDVTFQNTFTGGKIVQRAAGDVRITSYQGSILLKTNTSTVTTGGLSLYYATGQAAEVTRLTTTSNGVDINGNLNVSSNIAVGAAGSISGDASYAVSGKWDLGADGTNNYTFTGIGFPVTTNDPDLYLARGAVYEFVNGMGAHPFRIQSTANGSTGTQYNTGVTNNDVSNGTLKFEVPFSAPDTLYYQCTAHAAMGGKLYIYPTLR